MIGVCDKAQEELREINEEKERRENRKRVILAGLCPDCGRNLITKDIRRRFWDPRYDREMICPVHGVLSKGFTSGAGVNRRGL